MIETKDYTHFMKELIQHVKFPTYPLRKMLSIGCGRLNSDRHIKADVRLAIDWSDELLLEIKDEPGVIPIKFDAKDLCKILVPKSFDTICMFDFIEHLKKEDGEKLLDEIEKFAKMQILMFIPIEKEKADKERQIELQRERKEKNLSLGHHCSQWFPEEMEVRGYDVIVSPNYHKEKNLGAMICIKNL